MARARDIPGLHADLAYAAAAAAAVTTRTAELFDHAEGVLDTEDIERVHDMRVATRRLRAVLEAFAPCFPRRDFGPVLKDVKALADALGARRDPDVQLAALGELAAALGRAEKPGLDRFARMLRAEQAHGNELLEAALREATESNLCSRLHALAGAAAEKAVA